MIPFSLAIKINELKKCRERKLIKNFHCSECVTNFHYGFRAININKGRILEKKSKVRKRKRENPIFYFVGLREQLQTVINCNRSNGDAQSILHYRKLMILLWHKSSIFIEWLLLPSGRSKKFFYCLLWCKKIIFAC